MVNLFTHEDSAIAQASSNVTVITASLTGPVAAGDLLVCAAKSPDGSMTPANLSDSAGNTWVVAGGGNYLYLAYCLASKAAPNGLDLTVTTQNVSHHGVVVDRFSVASGYVAQFSAFSDNLTLSCPTSGINYQFGLVPPGTINGVQAGALAWMGFFVIGAAPGIAYSGGFQDGAGGTPAVIGSQVALDSGDGGFSEYVEATDASGTVAMEWYGTGGDYGGWAVQGVFTAAALPTGPFPSSPVPMVALQTLFRSTWAQRLPDVHAGDPFWARYADYPGLIDGGFARLWAQGDPAMPPAEPGNTAHGIAGIGAGTSNNSPGRGLVTPAGPPPSRQN